MYFLALTLNVRDGILAEYGVTDQSVYANVSETAEEPEADPAIRESNGEALGGVMDDTPVTSVSAANETAAAPPEPVPSQ